MKRILSIAIVLLVVVAAGCSTYDKPRSRIQLYGGAPRPASEELVLLVPESVGVRTINGIGIAFNMQRLLLPNSEIRLLPGKYGVRCQYNMIFDTYQGQDHEKVQSQYVTLDFEGKAGEVYEIRHDPASSLRKARRVAKDPNLRIEKIAGPQ